MVSTGKGCWRTTWRCAILIEMMEVDTGEMDIVYGKECKTNVEMEGRCHTRHERLEDQGGLCHRQGEMERSLVDLLPCRPIWRRR